MSVKKGNREGPAKIQLDSEEVQRYIKYDMHANNYRDGEWGSMRHIVVKEGNSFNFDLVSFHNRYCRYVFALMLHNIFSCFLSCTPDFLWNMILSLGFRTWLPT